MNFNEMTTFVRTHADTDDVDAPDTTLQVYALQAYDDIRRRISSWVDKLESDTLTVSSGTESYALNGGSFTTGNIEFVRSVNSSTETLEFVPFHVLRQMLDDGTQVTADATYYSVSNNTLYLYPTPSASATYTVWGYKEFTDWTLGATEPDIPVELHRSILHYMLGQYFLAQEDPGLYQLYMGQYETSVGRFIAASMRQSNPLPRVLGGRRVAGQSTSYSEWVRRNTEGI